MAFNRTVFQKDRDLWNQYKIKIASTLIAFFIWFLVVTGDFYEYKTSIPIEITQNNPDYIITSPIPEKADVIVQGPGRYLFSFMLFKEGRLRLDVDWKAGSQIHHPSIDHISLSGNARNLTIRRVLGPDSVRIVIEKLVTKKRPVRNMISIKPLAGYTIVGDIIVEPESVRVQGPKIAISELDSIETETIIKDNLKYPIQKEFRMVPPANKQISLIDTKVTVAADIQQLLEKVITQIPVIVRYSPQNIDAFVSPAHLSVKIQGGREIVSRLEARDINAYIEYQSDLDSVVLNYPVEIEDIPGIQFRDVNPDRFKITLTRNEY